MLESGQLRVSRFSGFGVEIVLAVVDAPAAIGELALIDGAPRDASVIAQQPVTVRIVPRSTFHDLLHREPAVVDGLLRSLVTMVRAGNARHAMTVGLDVPGRLAACPLARAAAGPGSQKRLVEITIGRSQGQLAAELTGADAARSPHCGSTAWPRARRTRSSPATPAQAAPTPRGSSWT